MITTFFLLFANYVISTIVSVLPSSSGLPADVQTSLVTFGGYVGILDPILPVSTMATVFGLVIAFELAIFAFKGIRWVVGYIPFIGKSS